MSKFRWRLSPADLISASRLESIAIRLVATATRLMAIANTCPLEALNTFSHEPEGCFANSSWGLTFIEAGSCREMYPSSKFQVLPPWKICPATKKLAEKSLLRLSKSEVDMKNILFASSFLLPR